MSNNNLSVGERRLGIVFEKGNNGTVKNMQERFARLINDVQGNVPENERSIRAQDINAAKSLLVSACLLAVKSLGKKG